VEVGSGAAAAAGGVELGLSHDGVESVVAVDEPPDSQDGTLEAAGPVSVVDAVVRLLLPDSHDGALDAGAASVVAAAVLPLLPPESQDGALEVGAAVDALDDEPPLSQLGTLGSAATGAGAAAAAEAGGATA
jgi:hypothetical protein